MRHRHQLAALALFVLLPAAALAFPRTDSLVPGFTPTVGPVSPDGKRATIDLPRSQHMKNIGGSDGAGLCVPTSLTHSARWQNVRTLDGFREWLRKRPGGSHPTKLARDLKLYCASIGVPVPPYVMGTGVDPSMMELALKTRRCPAITHTSAHMVSGMHLDADGGAILDNNFSRGGGPGRWEWARDRAHYLDVYARAPNGRYGWVVVLLAPPPPPGVDADDAPPSDDKPGPWVDPVVKPRPAPPSCPDGRCPLQRPRWHRVELAGGEVLHQLYDGAALVGVIKADGWHPATSPAGWQLAAEPLDNCPAELPAEHVTGRPAGELVGGVDLSGVDLSVPRFWLNGEEVATAGGEVPGLTDDSGKYHLTIVTAGAGARSAADVLKLPGAALAHVQVYGPTDWPVKSGRVKPGVTLQAPASKGGAVLFHSADVDQVGEALKHTDPAYRPVAPQPRPKVEPVGPAPAPCPNCPNGACPCNTPSPRPGAPAGGEDLGALVALILAHLYRRFTDDGK